MPIKYCHAISFLSALYIYTKHFRFASASLAKSQGANLSLQAIEGGTAIPFDAVAARDVDL